MLINTVDATVDGFVLRYRLCLNRASGDYCPNTIILMLRITGDYPSAGSQ